MQLETVLGNFAQQHYVYMPKLGTCCLNVALPFTFAKTGQPVAAFATHCSSMGKR